MAPKQTIHFHAQSIHNTNTSMAMLQGKLQQKKSTTICFKIVHTGSEDFPVSMLDMVSISGKF